MEKRYFLDFGKRRFSIVIITRSGDKKDPISSIHQQVQKQQQTHNIVPSIIETLLEKAPDHITFLNTKHDSEWNNQ